jgi:hypothetical protein
LNTKSGDDAIEIGTRVRGTVKQHEGDSLLVAIQLAVGHPVTDARNLDIDLVQTETMDLRTTMTVGQTRRINCGRSKMLEIHIEPITIADDEPSDARETSASSVLNSKSTARSP